MECSSMDSRVCARCGARWFNGRHYWATGKPGSELDLAGLVCNVVNDPRCINRCKGKTGGDTWAQRREFIDQRMDEIANEASRFNREG